MGETVRVCRGLTVREKSKGSRVYYVFFNHKNRRVNKRIGEFDAALSYAKAAKDKFLEDPELLIEKLRRKPPKPKVPTFEQAAETWLENVIRQPRKKGGLAQSSIERYEQMLRDYVYPMIGSKKCDRITPQLYAELLEVSRAKMSLSSIGVINRVVSGTILYAVSQGRVAMADPTSGITKALGLVRDKKKEAARTVRAMNQKQIEEYLDCCASNEPYYYPFFAFLFNTGCRSGEAFGLTWDNIDFDNGMITFSKAMRKGRMGDVKNQQQRTVEVAPEILTMLRTLQAQQKEHGAFRVKGPVFLSISGGHMPQSTIDNVNRRIIKRTGLPYFNPHKTRHTFITESLRRGADLRQVSEYAGHHDTRVTQVSYGHLEEKARPTNAVFLGSAENGKTKRLKKNTTKKSGDEKVTKLERGA